MAKKETKTVRFDDGSALRVTIHAECADVQFDRYPDGVSGHKTGPSCRCVPKVGRVKRSRADGSTSVSIAHRPLK